MKIAIGSDEAGYELKELVRKYLVDLNHEVEDFGTFDNRPVLYPDIAFAVAEQVAAGRFQRAILMCGTGIGMSICANKVPGVRAAQAHDTYSAERARKSNDAQVLALGARVVREVGDLVRRAKETGKRLATLAVDTEVRFRSATDRAAFSNELTDAITKLVSKYHDESAPGGRAHRLVVVAHPLPQKSHLKEPS